jgi:hypothetical protein
LAEGAEIIAIECYIYVGNGGFTGGQIFNSLDYNVILKEDDCSNIGKKVKREVCSPQHTFREVFILANADEQELMGPIQTRDSDVQSAQQNAPEVQSMAPRQITVDGMQSLHCLKDGWRTDWQSASTSDLVKAIANLRGSDWLNIGPGWGNCQQIQCVNSAAIYWCNDVCPSPPYPNQLSIPFHYTPLTLFVF